MRWKLNDRCSTQLQPQKMLDWMQRMYE